MQDPCSIVPPMPSWARRARFLRAVRAISRPVRLAIAPEHRANTPKIRVSSIPKEWRRFLPEGFALDESESESEAEQVPMRPPFALCRKERRERALRRAKRLATSMGGITSCVVLIQPEKHSGPCRSNFGAR